jgi:hypothetical protein
VSRAVERDVDSGTVKLVYAYGGPRRRLPDGVEIAEDYRESFELVEGDPLSARVETANAVELALGGVRTRIETRSAMWCDAERFLVTIALAAYEGDAKVFERRRELAFPRDHV